MGQRYREDVQGYESLRKEFDAAYEQAARGKGKERHAHGQPFDRQRMQTISHLIREPKGMLFQAIKKSTEAMDLPTLEAQLKEIHGAMVYLAGLATYLRATNTDQTAGEGALLDDDNAAMMAAVFNRDRDPDTLPMDIPSFLAKPTPLAARPSLESMASVPEGLAACETYQRLIEAIEARNDGRLVPLLDIDLKLIRDYIDKTYTLAEENNLVTVGEHGARVKRD